MREQFPFPPDHIVAEAWLCPALFVLLTVPNLIVVWWHAKKLRVPTVVLFVLGWGWFLLMLPRFQGAREAAPRTQCKNNLKSLGAAILQYHDENGALPAAVTHNPPLQEISWRVQLLPYMTQQSLATGYDRNRTWNHPANLPTAQRKPDPYVCPTNPRPRDDEDRWFTAYTMLTGPGTANVEPPRNLDAITDGLGETILLSEACGLNIVWTDPRDADTRAQEIGINLPGPKPDWSAGIVSSYHVGGAHVLLGDGSVRFLSERTDPEVVRALTTTAAGDF